MRPWLMVGAALALVSSTPAFAQQMITLGGSAKSCFEAAKAVQSDTESERLCTLAIEYEVLSSRDLAGTYANRGSIKFNRGDFDGAQQDFERAIRVEPLLGESYINRGASLQRMGLFAEAVAEIDHGLTLNLENPARAYFNRGVARQGLNDLTGAYLDFRRAAELAPQWEEAKLMVDQFVVEPKGGK
jgi:tetratricopeptide (TPR) repeat protein